MKSNNRQLVFGFFGIFSAVVAVASIFVALSFSPGFSWEGNWLSDLGGAEEPERAVSTEAGAFFFNSGMAISGALAVVFALGVWKSTNGIGRIGAVFLLIGAVSLAGVGFFPGSGPYHLEFSAMFFASVIIAMAFLGIRFLRTERLAGVLTLAIWMVAVPFALMVFALGAVPELVAASSISFWAIMMGARLIRVQ